MKPVSGFVHLIIEAKLCPYMIWCNLFDTVGVQWVSAQELYQPMKTTRYFILSLLFVSVSSMAMQVKVQLVKAESTGWGRVY